MKKKRENKYYFLRSHKWTSAIPSFVGLSLRLVHLTTTNPAKSLYKCTVINYAIHTQKTYQWESTDGMDGEPEEERKVWKNKIRMSHEHKNTTYCATEPIQMIRSEKNRDANKTSATAAENENKKYTHWL